MSLILCFFGISPREAEKMDPQQRLLLEVTWEAFEDSGLIDSTFSGSKTGVFIGGFNMDNMINRVGEVEREIVDAHSAISSSMTMLSNRISYTFDLRGPSLTIDTACSSSLVATHFACQSLRSGESDMAIAGGANIMLSPDYPIIMSKGHFLSDHGRSMAFDERASGYGRGEGAGVVILKTLSAAKRDKDQIYSLIQMTGVNQDGHTMGITLPNSDAQEELIREVYKKAGIQPAEVQYVEAHGTGTQAGDPKEALALDAVLKVERELSDKCLIGSVKTNIGHLEAAAGIAGLIKTSLSFKYNKIPASLHFNKANPAIPFDDMNIRVSTELQDWPKKQSTRYAGVNSFGYGGTNAHVLLQEAPEVKNVDMANTKIQRFNFIPISARSESALKDLAAKYAYYSSSHRKSEEILDFVYTISQRRSHHSHRMVLLSKNNEDIDKDLQFYSMGRESEKVISGQADLSEKLKTVFVYTGMGPQWFGMGEKLMEAEPVFLNAMHRCDDAFKAISGWSVIDAMRAGDFGENISETEIAQPANFIIQVSLTELWSSWGIKPDAVIGHSVGEVSAAYISGALSLEAAVKVCYHRSRLQKKTVGVNDGMLAIGLSEKDATNLIAEFDNIEIAAVNASNSVTLSGNKAELQELSKSLGSVFNHFLTVDIAYHSSSMDLIKDEVMLNLKDIKLSKATIPLYSTVTGGRVSGMELDAAYWWGNIRKQVRFHEGISNLINNGFNAFLEIGPHPVLGHSIKEIAFTKQVEIHKFHSFLYGDVDELHTIYSSLASLYTKGYDLNWSEFIPSGGKLVSLPNYPWQKQRYWKETVAARQDRFGLSGHIFLNNKIPAPQPTWSVDLNSNLLPFINDHRVFGEVVFPGTGFYEAALAIYTNIFKSENVIFSDFKIHKMLFIEQDRNQYLSSQFNPKDNRFYLYRYFSDDENEWELIAEGKLETISSKANQPIVELEALKSRLGNKISAEHVYPSLIKRGLLFGESFQSIKHYFLAENEALLRVEMDPIQFDDHNKYFIHPGLLDAAGHASLLLVPGNYPYVPVTTESFKYYGPRDIHACWFHVTVTNVTPRSYDVSYVIFEDDGNIVAEVENVECRLLRSLPIRSDTKLSNYVYGHQWHKYSETFEKRQSPDRLLLFTNHEPIMLEIESGLTKRDIGLTRVYQANEYFKGEGSYHVNPNNQANYLELFSNIQTDTGVQIIFSWPLSSYHHEPDFNITSTDSLALIHLAQALNKIDVAKVNLVILTRGSQSVVATETVINVNHNALWGLGLLISNENPNITVRLIDLDIDSDVITERYVNYILSAQAQDLAFRSSQVYVQRLHKIDTYNDKINQHFAKQQSNSLIPSSNDEMFNRNGTYLVIGGTKGVGLEISRWLANKGIGKLILVSRTGLDDDGSNNILDEFEGEHVSVELHTLDIADNGAVDSLFSHIKADCPPLCGVIHLAAVYDDDYLQSMSKTRLDRVLSPKVSGVLNIYKHVKEINLKFLLLFSSLASVASLRRQASYIAANRFLDSFASYASANSTPTMSINFGPIAEAGQVSRDERLDEYLSNTGMFPIPITEVLQFIEVILNEAISNIGLYHMDWKRWGEIYEQAGKSSRFVGLTAKDDNLETSTKFRNNVNALALLDKREQGTFIENILIENLSDLLKFQRGDITAKSRLNDLGVDSLMSLDFVLSIKSELGYEISATDLAKNPSLAELTTAAGSVVEN